MITQAILKINPNAEFAANEDNINDIQWYNGTPPIPKEQILAIIPQVELDMAMEALRDITEGLTTKEQVEAVVFPNKPQGII